MDAHPFVDVLISDEILNGDASPVVFELISIAVSQGKPLKKKTPQISILDSFVSSSHVPLTNFDTQVYSASHL